MSSIGGISTNMDGLTSNSGSTDTSAAANSFGSDEQVHQLIALLEDLLALLSTSELPSLSGMNKASSGTSAPSMHDFMDSLAHELNCVSENMNDANGPVLASDSSPANISLLQTPLSGGAQAMRLGLGDS